MSAKFESISLVFSTLVLEDSLNTVSWALFVGPFEELVQKKCGTHYDIVCSCTVDAVTCLLTFYQANSCLK